MISTQQSAIDFLKRKAQQGQSFNIGQRNILQDAQSFLKQKAMEMTTEKPVKKTGIFSQLSKTLMPGLQPQLGIKVLEWGKSVGQQIARSFVGTAASIKELAITPKEKRKEFGEATYTPIGPTEQKIFGTNKPISLKTIGEETLAIGGEDFKNKWGKYAIPIGTLMAGLDIIPTGGVGTLKSVAKNIAKTEDIFQIAKYLKQVVKGSEEEINFLAKSLSKVNKEDDVLKVIQGASKAKKAIPLAQKAIPEAIPAEKGIIPQEIKKALSLIDEATIKIKTPKSQGLEIPGRPGSSISLPYISASVKLPMDIGRQSLIDVSKTYALSPSLSDTLLKTSSSNLKNLTSIQFYGSTLKKARQVYFPEYKQIMENIAKKIPEVEFAGRIKKEKSIVDKIQRYLNRKKNPLNIPDIVAGRLNTKDLESINNSIRVLQDSKELKIVDVEDYFTQPTKFGFRGINIQAILSKGGIVEIQLTTPESLKIVDAIHPIYEKWRTFEGLKLPKMQELKRAADIEKARKIADKIWGEIKAIKGVGEVKTKGFKWQERGFTTSVKEEFPQLKVAGQYVPRSTDRLAIKAKNLIKSNLAEAERIATARTDDDAIAIGSELLKHYSDEATKATSEVVKDALYEKAGNLANDMARTLTEQGRSIQAASILSRLTPEGQLKFAAREIQKYNEEVVKQAGGIFGLKKKIPELTAEQSKNIDNEYKAIQGMAEGDAKAMRFQKLQNHIQDLIPSPLFKKVIAVWKAGLLTGIKTTGLNIFANISHFQTEIAKDIPSTMVDMITSLFTGKRAVSLSLRGIPIGAQEGIRKGLRYLTTGFDERNIGVKLDYRRINFGKGKIAKALQTYTDSVFRLLGTEDQPFYYATKIRSMYEQAKVAAINKGLRGAEAQKFIDNLIQNPTDQMIKYASFDAETAVFQNKTLLGEAARGIQKTGIGEVIVPFGRTPSSVAMQILNYSPMGFIKTIVENVGKGRFDQRLFSQGMGRAITGTGAIALGSLLFKKGMMTLDRPKGEKEQKLWELEGKKANSIYDPVTKKWRTIQTLGPWGNVLLIGGHFQNAFNTSGSPTEAMLKTLAGSSKSFSEQTFLTGVSNFIEAISDPERSAEFVAGSTLASLIPTIISDIAKATDTRERRANEILEKFQARIPGVRQTLEPQITTLGEEKETIGNPLEVMIDPTRPSPAKSTPLIQELRRLWDAGLKVSPTLLGDKKGYESLTREQNTELWKRAGEITKGKLNGLIIYPPYQELPDDEKGKTIENFVEKAKINARAEIILNLTQGLTGDALIAELSKHKKSGLMTKEVYKKYLEIK